MPIKIRDAAQAHADFPFSSLTMRAFPRQAKGWYVLIIHQDAIPLESAARLLRLVDLLEQHDPDWG